jgi:hypothetical protein
VLRFAIAPSKNGAILYLPYPNGKSDLVVGTAAAIAGIGPVVETITDVVVLINDVTQGCQYKVGLFEEYPHVAIRAEDTPGLEAFLNHENVFDLRTGPGGVLLFKFFSPAFATVREMGRATEYLEHRPR